jgi:hypothetical protein
MMHNIERSKFRAAQYVGWDAKGCIYLIRKDGRYWRASLRDTWTGASPCYYGKTLKEISTKLEKSGQ